jgi:hypothetical protein
MVGVLAPRPMIVLLFERKSNVVAAMATVAGVLAYMLMIEVPNFTCFVF